MVTFLGRDDFFMRGGIHLTGKVLQFLGLSLFVHEGTEEDVTLQKVIRKLSGGVESLGSAGVDDQQFLLLTQNCFLTQHVLEPTSCGNVLNLILSS